MQQHLISFMMRYHKSSALLSILHWCPQSAIGSFVTHFWTSSNTLAILPYQLLPFLCQRILADMILTIFLLLLMQYSPAVLPPPCPLLPTMDLRFSTLIVLHGMHAEEAVVAVGREIGAGALVILICKNRMAKSQAQMVLVFRLSNNRGSLVVVMRRSNAIWVIDDLMVQWKSNSRECSKS